SACLTRRARLPARGQGYPWRRAYGTEAHGTSLKTLYRNLAELDCPVLLVIKDMDNQVHTHTHTHTLTDYTHTYTHTHTHTHTQNTHTHSHAHKLLGGEGTWPAKGLWRD